MNKVLVIWLSLSGIAFAVVAAQSGNERIFGGTKVTNLITIPAVLIYKGYFICGGSLIHRYWILTAAHCTTDKNAIFFRVRVNSLIRSTGGQLSRIIKIVIHPNYNERTMNYDASLLKMKLLISPPYINLVPLNFNSLVNESCTILGWGKTEKNITSEALLSANVRLVSESRCKSQYEKKGIRITPIMLCASAPGKDSCQGDSGGPLIDSKGNLAGIVSFGIGCAIPLFPGVYTKIAAIRKWIDSTIRLN